LLDYLAASFRDGGWSIKQVIRQIVLSHAYRLSANGDDASAERDPANTYYWRRNPERLEAEALRDALLFASGKLQLTPPARSVVAEMAGNEVGRKLNTDALNRAFDYRSVYLPILRSLVPETLRVFDFAEPSIVVGKRSVTTVPSQALFFLNSPYVLEQADATAELLLVESLPDDAARVDEAYLRTLCRRPSDAERTQAIEFVDNFAAQLPEKISGQKNRRKKAWSAFCQALFAAAEFRFVE
jgi:hypothetical protein